MIPTSMMPWKQEAHAVFDRLWKTKRMTRNEAYKWLAAVLMIKPSRAHISKLSQAQCAKLVELTKYYLSITKKPKPPREELA